MAVDNVPDKMGTVPIPDPTKLTTDAVTAATSQWRRDLEGVKEVIETRLDAIDRATELHRHGKDEIVGRLERQLLHLKELVEVELAEHAKFNDSERRVLLEKFDRIALQFRERDVRTATSAVEAKEALAAALQAAKELVNVQALAAAAAAAKSEDSFTKQFDQIAVTQTTATNALDARITEQAKTTDARLGELKERIDRGGGILSGATDQRGESRDRTGLLVSAGVAFIALISLVFVIYHGQSNTTSVSDLPSCTKASLGQACISTK